MLGDGSWARGSGRAYLWIRSNILGLVAIFIALNGTAVAVTVAEKNGTSKAKASKKKKKAKAIPGPQGPAGMQGQPGAPGAPGASGSPDTGAEILTKLAPIDGAGSGLDADQLDGLNSNAFLSATAGAGGDLTGNYPNPTVAPGSITPAKLSFDPATQAELGAFGTTLSAPGTINAGANPLDWTKLKSVPAGFADGTDNDTIGGPPSGPAGSGGGALSGTYPNPTLDVIGGPCASGTAVRSISNQAALTCGTTAAVAAESASSTPGVFGLTALRLDHGAPTTITDLTNGDNGQEVTLVANTANVTINDGGSFALSAPMVFTFNDTLSLVLIAGIWYETGRSVN